MDIQSENIGAAEWLADHWPKATLFLAIYSFAFFYLYLYEDNFLLFLLWLQTSVYWLHQFEEYVYPGSCSKNPDSSGSTLKRLISTQRRQAREYIYGRYCSL